MFIISYILILICVLISVAFVTLLERSILGYIQLRSGPNKLGVMGLLQPFSDGLSLFFKEQTYPLMSNFMIYYNVPIFMLIMSFFMWVLYPMVNNLYENTFGFLFFVCCLGVSVYGIMLTGWSSNSNYSLLGCIRAICQTISYEVSMIFLLVCMFVFVYSYNFISFCIYQAGGWFIFFSLPFFFCWFSSCLAEVNRSPFDFAEGESELVSGFNVEYSSGGFAYIFLSEYMNIIFMSLITCLIFMGANFGSLFFFIKIVFFCFLFIWVRGTLPRYRYDKLMYLTWKFFLPFSISYLMFYCGILLLLI